VTACFEDLKDYTGLGFVNVVGKYIIISFIVSVSGTLKLFDFKGGFWSLSDFFFSFWWYWGLNSGPMP
jgi:hypothetical protein